ncbi:MAG TPA: HdeD family acid-resistance protein [Pseudolabrys sp.]|nr:HdeD family acid-resistance protein [Pseudolabrys sp.]
MTDTPQSLQASVARAMREHWRTFLVEGIILLVLGVLAILLPPFATLGITILLGWLFLISGVMGLITTFMARGAPGFWWSLISGILGVIAGLVLLITPGSGAVSLTLVLIAFFIVEGVASILYAFDHRAQLSGRWEWMVFSGIVDLVLAVLIFAGLPGSAAWALGLLVGINMIFGGAALIGIALHARQAA